MPLPIFAITATVAGIAGTAYVANTFVKELGSGISQGIVYNTVPKEAYPYVKQPQTDNTIPLIAVGAVAYFLLKK